ncbi:MAG: hypothetical protein ACI85O_001026 [Saprospiraceae bacterium]|jgi:hypothetical protein
MNLAKNEKVEKYLLNKMTESEKSAFQFELMQDESLQQEVKALRKIQKILIAQKRITTEAQNSSIIKKWTLSLLFFLALPALFFFWNKMKVETTPTPSPIPKIKIIPPITAEEEAVIQKQESTEEIQLEEEIKRYAPKKRSEEVKKEPENKPQPIAIADPVDLVPNPLFDQITSGTRGGELDLILDTPAASAILSWQKSPIILPFSGIIMGNIDSEPSLQLLIFSNKKS